MTLLKPSRDMWLVLAALSITCAIIRYLDGSAVLYTVFYAILIFVGIGIATFLLTKKKSYFRANGSLLFATLVPPFLLFIDLSSGWRVTCYLVIGLVAAMEWNSERKRRSVS